jgi:hypothetical protein
MTRKGKEGRIPARPWHMEPSGIFDAQGHGVLVFYDYEGYDFTGDDDEKIIAYIVKAVNAYEKKKRRP